MPIQSYPKSSTVTSVDYSSYTNTDFTGLIPTGIYKIDESGNILSNINYVAQFLLNPSTWEETKSSNWSPQTVPGQSDPVYQWVSSGPRTVSFEALVTKDTYNYAKSASPTANSTPSAPFATFGQIASLFAQVASPPPMTPGSNVNVLLDISDNLNYYRSLLYPKYTVNNNSTQLTNSPPLVVLYSGTAINSDIPDPGNTISSNTDIWVVTSLRIRITKQMPNLAPMEALVGFELSQYTTQPFSESRFSPLFSR